MRVTGTRLDDWVGRERETHDILSLERARMLAATLDQDPGTLHEGAALPPGWHWIYFPDAVPRSELAEDGHERRGDFLPPVPLPRRMWAGGRLRFDRPLLLGRAVRRVSTIRAVEEKEGRTGPLVFVTVEHTISDDAGPALVEQQDIVYLGRPGPATAADEGRDGASSQPSEGDPGREPRWTSDFVADEVTLFRFSALTFNGHRIHFDQPYATRVEGYPGLVVHGPLLALVLLGAGAGWAGAAGADEAGPGSAAGAAGQAGVVGRYAYRSLQPLFCGETLTLQGRPVPSEHDGGAALELWGEHERRGTVIRGRLSTRVV